MEEDIASALSVLKALLLAGCAEWLAWEAGYVHICMRGSCLISCCYILINLFNWKVGPNELLNFGVMITREKVFMRHLQISEGLIGASMPEQSVAIVKLESFNGLCLIGLLLGDG